MSHPTRGAWIEIELVSWTTIDPEGRTPPGVRGLKSSVISEDITDTSRTPPGVRGLKFTSISLYFRNTLSHPTRGAWIEIRRAA